MSQYLKWSMAIVQPSVTTQAGLRMHSMALACSSWQLVSPHLCFDALFSDTAVGACARAMGIRLARLPGGFVVNNYRIRATIDDVTLAERAAGRLP